MQVATDHYYHINEEEDVVLLVGQTTMLLDSERHEIRADQHLWFHAEYETAHHFVNTSSGPFRFFVFGERRDYNAWRGTCCD